MDAPLLGRTCFGSHYASNYYALDVSKMCNEKNLDCLMRHNIKKFGWLLCNVKNDALIKKCGFHFFFGLGLTIDKMLSYQACVNFVEMRS